MFTTGIESILDESQLRDAVYHLRPHKGPTCDLGNLGSWTQNLCGPSGGDTDLLSKAARHSSPGKGPQGASRIPGGSAGLPDLCEGLPGCADQ
jgi:hypothetical protein